MKEKKNFMRIIIRSLIQVLVITYLTSIPFTVVTINHVIPTYKIVGIFTFLGDARFSGFDHKACTGISLQVSLHCIIMPHP